MSEQKLDNKPPPSRLTAALEHAEKMAPRRNSSGYIYVIGGDGGTLKVGLSLRPQSRLHDIISNKRSTEPARLAGS